MNIGYARVSTEDQTTAAQLDALRAAGCQEIFEDVVSGASTSRDGLDACILKLEPGDVLVVAALDRLGRSMAHLVTTVHDLADRGIGVRSLRESIDTTSATGRLILGIFAALAAFERDLIRERTIAALAAKRRRGERLGPKPALTPSQIATAKQLVDAGENVAHVARVLRCGRSTLYRALAS